MEVLNFTDCSIRVDERGAWLNLLLDKQHLPAARQFVLKRKDKPYTAELKEYREKRSMNSNSYLWALLDRLADALHTTKEELYLQKIREVGVFKDFCLTEDEAKTFRVAWEKLGQGWPTEQVDYTSNGERLIIRAYYGSSTYNSKQMARLLDSVVEDCKSQDIETLTERELSSLNEEWGK